MTVHIGLPRTRVAEDLIAGMRAALAHTDLAASERAERLYGEWYLRPGGGARTGPEVPDEVPGPHDVDLVAALRAAHGGDMTFEPGWTVERLSDRGRVALRRGDRVRVVHRADVVPPARVLLPPRTGDVVSVCLRDDVLDEAGFWFTFLGGWDPARPPSQVVRFYWAVRVPGTVPLVRLLSGGRLGGVPAALKVGAAPHLHGRPDAAVLYVGATDADEVAAALRPVAALVSSYLSPRTPPLTLPLATGLSAAEDPGPDRSFGQHRCEILAGAIDRVTMNASDDDLLRDAQAALRDAGVDPVQPYRSAGSPLGDHW